ncbi:MAG: AMP-binding protein [Rhodospirillaceae bacterium]|nr:AMP-binding protein [Rhodospirillaceae bacterium]
MTDGAHFDVLETRDPQAREAALTAALPAQVAHAKAHAPAYGRLLADIDPADVTSRAALAALPVTRKSALRDLQRADPPLGGLTAVPPGRLARIFASPGPIYDADSGDTAFWHSARALYATGFRPGDIVQNCFAYHFTPAGVMFEAGAREIGCAVIPAGTGKTELQAQVMAEAGVRGYIGTPDFLKVILEKADETGADVGGLRLAHVSGGALFPPLAAFYAGRGIEVFQSYGTADLGVIAYQTPAREGLVVDEAVLVEIVRPGTGDPVPDGEVGEVLVTTFVPDYPLLRFATGDLSAVLPGVSPCGRTNMRIKGWMGRADQTTKIKGMFVHPEQVAEVLKRHPGIERARLEVDNPGGTDTMALKAEAAGDVTGLAEAVAASLHAVTKLHGTVEIIAPGSLPNDGKVIDDLRKLG